MATGDDLIVGSLIIPAHELAEEFTTSGGPGGQHANRSETAVRLRFDIEASTLPYEVRGKLIDRIGPVIEVISSEERSQLRNRERARTRLAKQIAKALEEPKPRRATKPTRASRKRRLESKRARSQVKKQRQKPQIDD